MIPALFCVILAVGVTVFRFILLTQKRPQFPKSVFPIAHVPPIRDNPFGGCTAVPLLIGLSLAFWKESWNFVAALSLVLVIYLFKVTKHTVAQHTWRRVQESFHARIELSESAMRIFDAEEILSREVAWSEVIDLPRYQGLDASKKFFDHCVLRLKSGEVVLIDELVMGKRRLLKQIQVLTSLEFTYRRNSERKRS